VISPSHRVSFASDDEISPDMHTSHSKIAGRLLGAGRLMASGQGHSAANRGHAKGCDQHPRPGGVPLEERRELACGEVDGDCEQDSEECVQSGQNGKLPTSHLLPQHPSDQSGLIEAHCTLNGQT
jgi:hypothetical protein